MQLVVDIGNSKLKWGQAFASKVDADSVRYLPVDDLAQLWPQWQNLTEKPQAVWVSNVAQQGLNRLIQAKCKAFWSLTAQFVRSQAQADGLLNGYSEAERLGVDRWLGIIAAHQLYPDDNVCVIDCGTAITLDIVLSTTHGAQHQGGLILAGLYSLQHIFNHITVGVTAPTQSFSLKSGKILAQDTQTAVALGAMRMITATIEASILPFKPLRCLITGGDARAILAHLNIACEYHPHLVLQGLAHEADTQCA